MWSVDLSVAQQAGKGGDVREGAGTTRENMTLVVSTWRCAFLPVCRGVKSVKTSSEP